MVIGVVVEGLCFVFRRINPKMLVVAINFSVKEAIRSSMTFLFVDDAVASLVLLLLSLLQAALVAPAAEVALVLENLSAVLALPESASRIDKPMVSERINMATIAETVNPTRKIQNGPQVDVDTTVAVSKTTIVRFLCILFSCLRCTPLRAFVIG